VIGPLPPPVHGVTISTSLILANGVLRRKFDVEHVNTSDHRARGNVGRWEAKNIELALRSLARLVGRLRGPRGIVYLPLSQNTPAFLRDSLFIHAASACGWKVAAHLRGGEFRSFYEAQPAPRRLWIRLTLDRLDSVAVMGSSLRWIFEGLVAPSRVAVVPNGTPDPLLNGVRRESSTVLFLSNLRRRKGTAEAVEAALLVARDLADARFVFVGDWEDAELERDLRARAAAVGSRIQFLGPVSGKGKQELLASSSVLLFPPRDPEGHPRVVLEGLAAGLPVVTTNRGAIAETVIDGESGFVLDEPVPDDLAQRLLLLLRDDRARERMGEAARERYLTAFTQEVADRRLADWLVEVART
jgi:glycosyltransferase involved in cell wall biosynthesis